MDTLRQRPGSRRTGAIPGGFLVLSVLLVACSDDGNGPTGSLRFGQIGEVTVELEVPLRHNEGQGKHWQTLTWNSSGVWQIRESISYKGLPGDENLERTQGEPGEYSSLIGQLNDSPTLGLFDDLTRVVTEECPAGGTKVRLTIRDEPRGETETWIRCSEGNLATLETAEAGPDADAVRVIQAAILVRDFTVRPNFLSAYNGSIPFGTLDRGEDSGARMGESQAFFSPQEGVLDTPDGWVEFWRAHVGEPAALPPVVDWAREIVLVAAVGRRTEAGDSVEIRRVLQTGEGTQVNQYERIPGDFCSPAAGDHYPVHIVVAPRTNLPIRFSEPVEERVPCGF